MHTTHHKGNSMSPVSCSACQWQSNAGAWWESVNIEWLQSSLPTADSHSPWLVHPGLGFGVKWTIVLVLVSPLSSTVALGKQMNICVPQPLYLRGERDNTCLQGHCECLGYRESTLHRIWDTVGGWHIFYSCFWQCCVLSRITAVSHTTTGEVGPILSSMLWVRKWSHRDVRWFAEIQRILPAQGPTRVLTLMLSWFPIGNSFTLCS